MRAIYPSRTFKVLIGTGIILVLLLAVAISRAIIAGCPESWAKGDLLCLFLPAHTDLGTHLLTYAFMGTILLGVYSWLVVWRRQWSKTRLLIGNLVLLHAPGSKLERLTRRLGLKDKVHLLDYKAPLCFCAGFIGILTLVAALRLPLFRATPSHAPEMLKRERGEMWRNIVAILTHRGILTTSIQRHWP